MSDKAALTVIGIFFVFALFLAISTCVRNDRAWDAECRQKGGEPYRPYRSKPVCLTNAIYVEGD